SMEQSTVFPRPEWDKNDVSATWLDRISPQVNIASGEDGRAGWVDPRRVIYDHELMMMGDGGKFAFDLLDSSGLQRTYRCEGPSYIIIPPGVWHTCRGIVCRDIPRVWVHFDWTAVLRPPETPILTYWPASPLTHLVRHPPGFVPIGILTGPIPSVAPAFDIHARLTERFNHGTPRVRATSRALLLELLLFLLSPESQPPVTIGGAPAQALQIRRALDELAQKPFSDAEAVKPYLAGLGKSYDHQARLFRATYGVTPLQYVNAQRMERAKNLLRDTDEPVSAIAARLGFRDVVYFNRLFRKVVGTTPGGHRVSAQRHLLPASE
ncbi:MAG: helix-turn-helix domain-containing protein, partial [Chitinivibrionales bacterium]|nr:helix-turn-helix domain-containing protein [Chitinivibrionales bacterium]